MKKILLTTLIYTSLIMILLTGCDSNSEETSNIETTEVMTETTKIAYTEDEYKALCNEKYYDDFFESTPRVGELVKIYAFTSQKYKYSSGDMQGILTEDIRKKYNLALNTLACCVLHEETKDDAVPSYFGKHIYIMFVKDAELNLDSFKTGKYIIIYGEVIKNDNGTFVLPRYIEEE